jgi:hypothetical protein
VDVGGEMVKIRGRDRRTVVDAFGNGLEHLDVDGRGRAVVPVVLKFVIADDALRTFEAGEAERRLGGDARDDRVDVKGEDGRVYVHVVRVEDGGILGRGKDGIGQPRREGVLVRAVLCGALDAGSLREEMALALCTSALSLRSKVSEWFGGGGAKRVKPEERWRTVEYLGLFQEPFEPTPLELESLELLEDAALVDIGVVSELRAFYEGKNDRVFEAGEDGPDPVQGERVFCERVVCLHVISSTRCCRQRSAIWVVLACQRACSHIHCGSGQVRDYQVEVGSRK